MRFYILSLLLAIWCACALAINVQKTIIVSFPDDTPQSYVEKAMATLKEAGGVITHEFGFIKGFSAKASKTTIEAMKALGDKYIPIIEEDQTVNVEESVHL